MHGVVGVEVRDGSLLVELRSVGCAIDDAIDANRASLDGCTWTLLTHTHTRQGLQLDMKLKHYISAARKMTIGAAHNSGMRLTDKYPQHVRTAAPRAVEAKVLRRFRVVDSFVVIMNKDVQDRATDNCDKKCAEGPE